jgi:UDP-3-O-[3-hydroxymyristoyl] N-acetylglucosamine deacetylase
LSFPCEITIAKNNCLKRTVRTAHTIQKEVQREGKGLFSGVNATIKLCPAEEKMGVMFQRTDLPGQPILPARLEFVQGTPRCTVIGKDSVVSLQTVEHLLAVLNAYQIDNLLVQVSGPEIPVFDGSSLAFVEMIEEAGLEIQEEKREIGSLEAPLFWSQGDIHVVALPSEEFRISYTMHYPQSSFLKSQFYSTVVQSDIFKKEIAPCRTFSVYEEIAPLIEKGLFKGGSLENAVVIKEDKVVNPEGLRFADEMVRHKVLDMIGDLFLVGMPFTAHIIAIRSGHFSNNAFAKELLNHFKRENV